MMNKGQNILILNILAIVIFSGTFYSCSFKKQSGSNSENSPIVSVYGKTLYKADLDDAVYEGLNPADSTESANAYIKMWIDEELVYKKAKQNISDQDKIEEMVEKYRQSLTVFTYLEQLLEAELSRKISDSQLKSFYDENPKTFKLDEPLVKGLFLKIPQSSSQLTNLRQWYKSNTEAAKENIEKASIQNAVIYDYFYDRWITLSDIASNMPVRINNMNEFAKNNKNYEVQDSSFVYLLHIEEYALAGSSMPFDYAKPSIKDILINKHRESFLKRFTEDLYNKAVRDKDIVYYIE